MADERGTDVLVDAARAALEPVLGRRERIAMVARAVGSTLVLTNQRLVLVRDGAAWRPKTGIRAWDVDRSLSVRTMTRPGNRVRLLIECCGQAVGVFLASAQSAEALALVAEVRRRIHVSSPD